MSIYSEGGKTDLKGGFMVGEVVLKEVIEQKIFLIRGQKVMLDRDLAEL